MKDDLPTLTSERIKELRIIRNIWFQRLGKPMKVCFKGGFMELFQSLHEESINPGSLFHDRHGKIIKYGSISDSIGGDRLFRGENTIYPGDANSSLGRKVKDLDKLTTYTFLLIEFMQIRILEKFLMKKDMINSWKFGDIFVYIIAQHYGLPTRYLDITDDIDVALFFANTKEIDGKYAPILVKDCSDDNKYAALYYRIPNFIAQWRIHEIGYQPFSRCHAQRGYFIDTAQGGDINDFGLERNHQFTKYKFLRDDELTMEIFNQFNGGEKLFPTYEKNILTNVINLIKKITTFTKEELDDALKTHSHQYSYENVVKKMNELGYEIYNDVNRLNIEANLKFISFAEFVKREKINIVYRKVKGPS